MANSKIKRLFVVLLAALALAITFANAQTPSVKVDQARLSRYVVSGVRDLQGNLWIGSEGDGVSRGDARSGELKQFTVADGLGDDNAYALACDRLGRIWAGHLNHGVSVFDGQKWQNYETAGGISKPGSLSGPLGHRVFAIEVCPTDGDVWIATESGLTRYSEKGDEWSYYTKADGLPYDQIQAMAFDSDGNLFLGTQGSGLVIASAKDGYKNGSVVPAPDHLLNTASGSGLPGRLINDVTIGRSGTVYVGTTAGIAWSNDHGKTWQYARGTDYWDKANQSSGLPPVSPSGADAALLEDYVTAIAEGANGEVWVGHRRAGCERLRLGNKIESKPTGTGDSYVTAIVPIGDAAFLGMYGGSSTLPPIAATSKAGTEAVHPKLPRAAAAGSADSVTHMLKLASASVATAGELPIAVAMDDDWATRGDWIGRYGRHTAILCGMASPAYVWGAAQHNVAYRTVMGPRKQEGDSYRFWTYQMYTADPAAMEIPPVWLDRRLIEGATTAQNNRRHTQWNDHGDTYPLNLDGPNLYCTLDIPNGVYCLSIYDVNQKGRSANERNRDYPLSIRSLPSGTQPNDVSAFQDQPELAGGRITSFWNGVYKRFAVKGPNRLTLEVNRNNSFGAILVGVMIDEFTSTPQPYFADGLSKKLAPASGSDEIADLIRQFDAYDTAYENDPRVLSADRGRIYAQTLRWALAQSGGKPEVLSPALARIAATCCYRLKYFPQWEALQRQIGLTPARDIEKALKWEPKVENSSGMGYQFVNAYVTANHVNRGQDK